MALHIGGISDNSAPAAPGRISKENRVNESINASRSYRSPLGAGA
jgi:hypothetical protein